MNKINYPISQTLPIVLLLCSVSISSLWASGKQEEKYFIQLETVNVQHNRQLEKSFFEYGRKNDKNIVVYYIQNISYSDKYTNLKSGINKKFPILIYQYYEPTLTNQLIQKYYNNGEFSKIGYLGGILFIDTPSPNLDNLSLSIPHQSIGFDTQFIVNEILTSLNTQLKDEQGRILIIINSISNQEQSLSKEVFTQLQLSNQNSLHTIEALYTSTSLEDYTKNKNNPSNNNSSENLQKKLSSTIYELVQDYSTTVNDILVVIAPNDYESFISRKAVIDYNKKNSTTNKIPYTIGFGASPETENAILNKEMLLTFSVDYTAYVNTIMTQAKKLYEQTKIYIFTEEMIDNENAKKSFTTSSIVVPLVAIR